MINEQELGTKAVPVPVYHYHGLEDEFVPVAQDVELHQKWCALGVSDDFQLYPGDHLLTDPTAIGNVIKWIEERLGGKEGAEHLRRSLRRRDVAVLGSPDAGDR